MLPRHVRDRQVAVLQRLRNFHVGPAGQLVSMHDERLDPEAAPRYLDRSIFSDQPLVAAGVDADDGPVRLLAAEAARKQAMRRSEEHTSELQSLMRISYAVFCL